jgi:hypothetical protein
VEIAGQVAWVEQQQLSAPPPPPLPPPPPCSYDVSPPSATVGPENGSISFSLSTGEGCAWSTATASDFLYLTSPSSGSGPATLTYGIENNTGAESRYTQFNIAGQPIGINQAGLPPSGGDGGGDDGENYEELPAQQDETPYPVWLHENPASQLAAPRYFRLRFNTTYNNVTFTLLDFFDQPIGLTSIQLFVDHNAVQGGHYHNTQQAYLVDVTPAVCTTNVAGECRLTLKTKEIGGMFSFRALVTSGPSAGRIVNGNAFNYVTAAPQGVEPFAFLL